ncbi:hypothetical protein J1G34_06775 [Pseudomonas sp. Wu6]|uniref:hypothetical protein n=1 Tax=Pseudomonas sp. Wu6 TaxID=1210129 RepID=UPI001CA77ACC|nr:hypothetical protein [Pseudomonas sp. Wu6]MBY8928732.1 hypothetical protein [Pseudomonas sp. Wu6]
MSVEAIVTSIKDKWVYFTGGNAELNAFWLKYLAAFVVWAIVTGLIYWGINSEKKFGALNIARKHVLCGVFMVVFSVAPGTYVWYAFIDFKHNQQLKAANTLAESLKSWSSACEKAKQTNACPEPPDIPLITDGLLRREKPVPRSGQFSGTRIRKTITLEVNGKVLQHETIVDYPDKR